MFLSNRHRFIFFSVPKTGSSSVLRSLTSACGPLVEPGEGPLDLTVGEHRPGHGWVGGRPRRGWRKHIRPHELEPLLPGMPDYFQFCFVRNPWSWLVSRYSYGRANTAKWRAEGAPMGDAPPRVARMRAMQELDFEGFVEAFVARCRQEGTPFAGFLLTPEGRERMDFVGRLESLQSDFDAACRRVGLDAPPLPHANRGQHAPYTAMYSARSRALVAEAFAWEIERFGYRFEGARGGA